MTSEEDAGVQELAVLLLLVSRATPFARLKASERTQDFCFPRVVSEARTPHRSTSRSGDRMSVSHGFVVFVTVIFDVLCDHMAGFNCKFGSTPGARDLQRVRDTRRH